MKRKILIGFSVKTSAVWSKFFCHLFRHCVVIADGVLIQVGFDGVRAFKCGRREIRKLEKAGWVFLEIKAEKSRIKPTVPISFLTCVGFAKRAAGIRAPFVWTPDQLFRALVSAERAVIFAAG